MMVGELHGSMKLLICTLDPSLQLCLSWSPTLTELHCTAVQNTWSCLKWEKSRLLVQQPFAPWQVCGVL